MIVQLLVALSVSTVVSGAVFLALALFASRRQGTDLAELSRMLPATLGLLARLARDPDVPRSVRWRIGFALAYNAQPFVNIIPDFVPVIGFADNVVVTCWVLRSVIRVSGPHAVVRNWRNSTASLERLYAALHLGATPAT